MDNSTKENNRPVIKFQLRGISASVFENRSENDVPFYKVSITRTYKDGKVFKTATTFGRDDLPIVETVARDAWLAIMKLESQQSSKKNES